MERVDIFAFATGVGTCLEVLVTALFLVVTGSSEPEWTATTVLTSEGTFEDQLLVFCQVRAFQLFWFLQITDDIRRILTRTAQTCSAVSPWSFTSQVPLDIIPSAEIGLCGLLSSGSKWIRFSSVASALYQSHVLSYFCRAICSPLLSARNLTCPSNLGWLGCGRMVNPMRDEILFIGGLCDVF